jgi:hypothetical protein
MKRENEIERYVLSIYENCSSIEMANLANLRLKAY